MLTALCRLFLYAVALVPIGLLLWSAHPALLAGWALFVVGWMAFQVIKQLSSAPRVP